MNDLFDVEITYRYSHNGEIKTDKVSGEVGLRIQYLMVRICTHQSVAL